MRKQFRQSSHWIIIKIPASFIVNEQIFKNLIPVKYVLCKAWN